MTRRISVIILVLALAGLLGFGAWTVLFKPSGLPPEGFSRGNGRIEADLIDVSRALPGGSQQSTCAKATAWRWAMCWR